MLISIIIPAYNEAMNIEEILEKVLCADVFGFDKEVLIVDDFSEDGTREILEKINDSRVRIIFNSENFGKGHCIRKGIEIVRGDVIIIQDADLEYNPDNYGKLILPILNNESEVVYGSRFLEGGVKGKKLFYFGNRFLSFVTSLLYSVKISDMETCYKVFKRDAISGLNLVSNGFEIEPEVTSKFLLSGYNIHEVPIDYFPRRKSDGKKIRIIDGFIALWTLIYYRFLGR